MIIRRAAGRKIAGTLVALVATLTVGAVLVVLPGPAGAGPGPLALVVDTLADNDDFDDADGLCDDGPDGACSLREAVAVAAANGAEGGVVTFGVDGTFVLDEQIVMIGGGPVDIVGNGVASTTLDVQDPPIQNFRGREAEYRHFLVVDNDLMLDGMTLQGGEANAGGSVLVVDGAGLTTNDVHFIENTAFSGGALYADADNETIEIANTTFSGNTADNGGAIFVDADTATIVNSTFTGNEAAAGAAIYAFRNSTTTISFSTFSQNLATDGRPDVRPAGFQGVRSLPAGFTMEPSGIFAFEDDPISDSADVTISNSVLEKTTGVGTAECAGAITSGGANIVDDDTCSFAEAADVEETAANVGPLQDNGGATFTMALTAASAAVDVDPAPCSLTDQRGLPRDTDGDGDGTAGCDSGAYELQEATTTTESPTTTEPDGDVDADTATPATPTVARPTFTG